MLVLSRKLNQRITIGDQITVTVLQIQGNTVRLGIDAPRPVPVRRSELPPQTVPVASSPSSHQLPPQKTGNLRAWRSDRRGKGLRAKS